MTFQFFKVKQNTLKNTVEPLVYPLSILGKTQPMFDHGHRLACTCVVSSVRVTIIAVKFVRLRCDEVTAATVQSNMLSFNVWGMDKTVHKQFIQN